MGVSGLVPLCDEKSDWHVASCGHCYGNGVSLEQNVDPSHVGHVQ